MTIHPILRILLLVVAPSILLPSCASNAPETLEFNNQLATSYSSANPHPGDITLYLDEAFTTYSANFHYGQVPTFIIPIGDVLAQQAEVVARSSFASVSVVKGGPVPAGRILKPEVVRIVRTEPSGNMFVGVFLRWQVLRDQGKVYEGSVSGFGNGTYGSFVFDSKMQKELQDQLNEALGNAFRQSFQAILGAPELR